VLLPLEMLSRLNIDNYIFHFHCHKPERASYLLLKDGRRRREDLMKTKLLFVFITVISTTTAFAKEGSPMFEARIENRAAALEELKGSAISQKNKETPKNTKTATVEITDDAKKPTCC